MHEMIVGTACKLDPGVEVALAAYRHQIFVRGLGWQLPDAKDGMELDQFDRPDTLYIIGKDANDAICGCARLLPTTKPYLLAEVFPDLLNGFPAPRSPDVWELSRFATKPMSPVDRLTQEAAKQRFRALFAEVARVAIDQGAARLITFTAAAIERMLRGLGLHVHRAGKPKLIDGEPVLAMWIELDDQTRSALGIAVADRGAAPAH